MHVMHSESDRAEIIMNDEGYWGWRGWRAGSPITGIPFVNLPNSHLPNQ